ncbi:MAG: maleylpyruvate isomerase family mycothiol-dependent enzyme [Acidimicrobiales bacterium]|nr:maleylpyruvate isomerase family mycothiol-dependent enzyme [Acidimicrobiales bacterium]
MTYQHHATSLQSVLTDGGDFTAPSPCAGWTAADVVDHLIDTQRDFLTRHDVDLGPRPDGDPPTAWAAHVAAVTQRVDDETLHRGFDGYFGPTTVGTTLADFYGFDMVVHRWDVARALGRDTAFTDAEMDAMEASVAVFGEHLYGEGVCRAAVPVPAGASRQDRLLGVLGRDPR